MGRAISIHALLAESDSRTKTIAAEVSDFYPRSPCGERLSTALDQYLNEQISIHALLAESDRTGLTCGGGRIISIHALLAESDAYGRINDISRLIFLSTLSLRRATSLWLELVRRLYDFYPRSPCGERRTKTGPALRAPYFYPRSPCGERLHKAPYTNFHDLFLSTLSLRRATFARGSKLKYQFVFLSTLSLRRATSKRPILFWQTEEFLSTLSLRRATGPKLGQLFGPPISIHALLAESDC